MDDLGPAQVQRDVSLGSPPPSVTWRCDRSLGGRAGYPHGNHSVRVPDELGHLTSPRGRWLRRTERLRFGSSGRFRSVDDPDPYRSISAIHDDDFKDARQRVSAHSVTTCFAGHPAAERFTPSAGFGGLASNRGAFSTPGSPSSVPLTLRRCAGSRWSASQRPPASARESFVLLGARGSRVEPVSLGHFVRAS